LVGRQGDLFGQPPGHSAALALFEQWWQHYPRKVAKLQAQRTWMQIRPLPDHAFTERAIDAIERQKRDPEFWSAGGRYIPHPSTWLNAGRYLDEGLEERPASPSFRETCPHVPRCSTPTQCQLKTIKGEA
jgi:hypothetical protein